MQPHPPLEAATSISRYVVLNELGRGAMGRVLRAYDPKLQREVALKELHPGPLAEETVARLVLEARAMAKLSHPHVVAIYDVEELGARWAVLVMELVRGTTLRQWLAERCRRGPEIVAMFGQAGRGLMAAHAAGLLHRDFKPANVLVSASGIAKVMDFGLAKLEVASPSSPENSPSWLGRSSPSLTGISTASGVTWEISGPLTQTGTVMGTPRYMAPEQHLAGQVGPAADQYAFCVALWEALCAAPPFSGRTLKELEASKLGPPPVWPKAGVPRAIIQAIARGLSPRPEERWPSMEALLRELSWDPQRRLGHVVLGVTGALALSLVGLSYTTWSEARAERCSGAEHRLEGIWNPSRRSEMRSAFTAVRQAYADQAWTRTEAALDDYASGWAAMYTEACEASTIRGEQSPQMMDRRMTCLNRAVIALEAAVDVLAEADAAVVQRAHAVTGSLAPLSRCADIEALIADDEPPPAHEVNAVESARAAIGRARALDRAGRYGDAQQALAAAKEALTEVEYGPVQIERLLVEAAVSKHRGQYKAAESALNDALRLASRWKQWDTLREAVIDWMGVVGYHQRRAEDALLLRSLAEGLSQDDPEDEANFRTSFALTLDAQGHYAEAEAEHRAALALQEAVLGPDNLMVAQSRGNLATVLSRQGHYAEAEIEHRAALALREAALGPEHPIVGLQRSNLAAVLYAQGNFAEAEAEFRAVLALQEVVLGPDHPDLIQSHNNLAVIALAQEHYAEGEAELRAALALQEAALGPDHPDNGLLRNNLAVALRYQGKYAEAEVEIRAALAQGEAALDPDHPEIARSRTNLALILLYRDRPAEALPLAEKAWIRRQKDDTPREERAETAFTLAQLLWTVDGRARDRARARELAEKARSLYSDAGEASKKELVEVQEWLRAHNTP